MTYRRYSEIPQEEISMVAEFIEKLEENKIEFYPYLNYKTTKALSEICKDIEDADFISFYIFLRCDISLDVGIEEAKAAYYRLEDRYEVSAMFSDDELAMNLTVAWGKGGKRREVPLKGEVIDALREYLEGEGKDNKFADSEYLILTNRSPKMDRDAVELL